MLPYISSEFRKALRSRHSRIYMLCILAVSVLANLAIIVFRDYVYGTNDGTYGYNIIMFAGGFFWLPYYTTIFISNIVFGETYPDPFIKDRITKDLKRHHIYLGKLAATFGLLLVFVVLSFVAFIGISTLFQLSTGTLSAAVVMDFGINILCATPLFMAGCAMGLAMLFIFDKRRKAFLVFWIITVIIPRAVMFLGAEPIRIGFFKMLKDRVLLTPQFTTLQFFASRDVKLILITSIIYILISTLCGIWVFGHKEIDNLPADGGSRRKKKC